ncbi:isopenicillin N synthase family dioxygenase [Actinomadura roseirufa]|uniref:isopenicillin N synthase family dioxygenase n=1 Tax=Actinomadura roseirufa TaxID=2094049 RepID=UPI0010411D82|nr:2OG-Fe(II) oxygenase family protein [Actinomadura roseirufa]
MSSDTGERRPATVLDGYVPVIDLSGAGGGPGRAAAARAIGRACAESGFFTLVGHGVPRELIDRMYATTMEFFLLPPEEKEAAVGGPDAGGLRYSAGSAARSAGVAAPPDLCEIFSSNVLGDLDAERRAAYGDGSVPWTRPNVWPRRPETFRDTWLEYTEAMERLARDLMRLFALALGLDERFFDGRIDEDISTIVANFYYPQARPPEPGQMRKGPHTDWGTLTILYQDEVGGLQVHQDGHGWRDVPFVPGGFVINIGDMMAFWTGGHWVSTRHRVLNPVEGHGGHRLSIPFFHLPNHDAPIEPLPHLTGGAAEGRRAATTPGRWYQEKMAALYS